MTPDVLEYTLSYMEGLGSPLSLSVAILARYGEWDQVSTKELDPAQYNCSDAFLRDAAAVAFLKKADFLPLPPKLRKQRTVGKWWDAEKLCFRSNRRLAFLLSGHPSSGDPNEERIRHFVERVKKRIVNTIGSSCPPFVGRFGPGATLSDTSRRTTVPHKMCTTITATADSWIHLRSWSECGWGRLQLRVFDSFEIKEVRGNHFFTVPKTSVIDRPCAKEPSFNGFLQLGVGEVIRRRLRKVGIDLDHGQRLHQELARRGSRDSSLATIDLSSASDTIGKTLVEVLLPPDWYKLLASLRSPMTLVDGKWVLLEKFSSMGNGYTFELESLLFWAICCEAGDPDCKVLGDDIIVKAEAYSNVVAALKYFGFELNPRKSFNTGYFRESCGGDFFNGQPVRGFYLKEDPNEPQKLISLANGIRRVAHAICPTRLSDTGLLRAWLRVLDGLPSNIRSCRGPEELGDLVIHDEREHWTTRPNPEFPGTVECRVYRPTRFQRVRFERFCIDTQVTSAVYLMSTDEDDEGHFMVPREGVLGYGLGWSHILT